MIRRIWKSPLARGSAVLSLGTIGASALGYFFHLFVGRLVDAETYGAALSLNSLFNIMLVPSMALAMVATKFAAQAKADGAPGAAQAVRRYLDRRISRYGLVVFAFLLALTPWVGSFLRIREYLPLVLIWIITLVSFYSSVASGILSGWQRFRPVSQSQVLGGVAKLLGGILLVWSGFGLAGIVGAMTLGFGVSYLLLLPPLRRVLRSQPDAAAPDRKPDFSPLRRFIWPALAGNLAINILSNADMVLAKHNLDPTAAGEYGALNIVAKIIFFVLSVIPTVLFALSSEKHHRQHETRPLLRGAALLMALLSAAAIGAYFLFPGFVLGLLFGGKYASVAGYLGYFAVVVVLFSFANLLFSYLTSTHQPQAAYAYLAVALSAIPVLLWFGRSPGAILWIMGAAQLAAILSGLWFLFRKTESA